MNETGNETMTDTTAGGTQETDTATQTAGPAGGMPAQEPDKGTSGALPDTDWRLDPKTFEGSDIDPAFIDSYASLAKKYGMNQENATSLLKDAAEILNRMDEQTVTRQTDEWIEASRNDKEFGGAALDANLAIAKKAVDAYGTPEIKEFLETTGLGNHPEVIRLFYRVGKTLTEDGTVTGSTGANGIRTFDEAAKKLYGAQ